MFYHIFTQLIDYFSAFNLFRYITFRAAAATITAILISIILGPLFIKMLKKYQVREKIRTEGPQSHLSKEGTPTMGGVLVWVTVLFLMGFFSYLATIETLPQWLIDFDFLSRSETLLPLGVLVASALVGLLDDWFNVTQRGGGKGGGLKMKHRILISTLIAAVGAWWFYFKLDWDVIHIPFLGTHSIGLWYIPFFIFVIVATAFSVNETDGLDGLAAGTLLAGYGSLGALAFMQGKYDLVAFCGVITGALLAFLWFNINQCTKWVSPLSCWPC